MSARSISQKDEGVLLEVYRLELTDIGAGLQISRNSRLVNMSSFSLLKSLSCCSGLKL
jgi:hypothetical protein